MEINEYRERATKYFTEGYNCAQSVLAAFSDVTGISFEQSISLASSFGGGMGRLREVCGAVSGMFMVAGLVFGYTSPTDLREKATHYKVVQEMANIFKEENGSIICRDLLGITEKKSSPLPEERTKEYYKKRPCIDLVGQAADIIAAELKERDLI